MGKNRKIKLFDTKHKWNKNNMQRKKRVLRNEEIIEHKTH